MTSYILGLITSNPAESIGLALLAAELITRLTPTKADDCFVERLGHFIHWVMDFLKLPNIKKGEWK